MLDRTKGERLTVTVTDLLSNGNGVCRVDGGVLFVAGAAVGDVVEVQVTRVDKRYAEAEILRLITPSPDRTIPACAAFGQCGGCDLCHVGYGAELEAKGRGVKNLLRKAGLPDVPVAETVTDGRRTGYRNKAVVYPMGAGYGFMAKRSSLTVSAVGCQLLSPQVEALCAVTAKTLHRYGESAAVRSIYVRVGESSGEGMVCLVLKDGFSLSDVRYTAEALREDGSASTMLINVGSTGEGSPVGGEYRTLWGNGYVTDTLGGVSFRISAPAFYQVNHGCTELLYNKVDEYADIRPGDSVADLYCGVGTIGMYLAHRHPDARFWGVEIVSEAVEDARANAKANDLTNVEYFCGDAGAFDYPVDVAVVDPPRKGLSAEMRSALLRLSPRRIVYVSCDPATMARDLSCLTAEGYAVDEVTPVNMFPSTRHVESIVCLTRTFDN